MQIELFSDTVCPWCRIGKAHLEQALQQVDEDATIRWRTFILDPMVPVEGLHFLDKMSHLGNPEQLQRMFAQTEEAGKRAGVEFHFSKITISPNTTKSHQLIHIAPDPVKLPLASSIMQAYFENGEDIGDLDVLLTIAKQYDLDESQLRTRIEQGEGQQQIARDITDAQRFGIRAVPFFIIDQKIGVSGAQPPEVLLQAFHQAKEAVVDQQKTE